MTRRRSRLKGRRLCRVEFFEGKARAKKPGHRPKVCAECSDSSAIECDDDSAAPLVRSEFKGQIEYAEEQLRYAVTEKNEESELRAWFNLASVHHHCAQQYHKVLTSPVSANDGNAQAAFDHNIARALNCYSRAALLSKKLCDYNTRGIIYGSIGNILHLLGEYKEAIHFHTWRWKAATHCGDDVGQCRALQNLGNEYANLKNYSKAIEYHAAAEEIALRLNDHDRAERCRQFILCASEILLRQ
ncbi:hypothetical protein Q1695_004031 [Nippostrongylus brasiliensis]|nr:hypothetical protein Q1695_004031 [Nippostrongylus brasiliensis]